MNCDLQSYGFTVCFLLVTARGSSAEHSEGTHTNFQKKLRYSWIAIRLGGRMCVWSVTTRGDDRFRQRDSWCVFASVRDRTVSRYPTVQPIDATSSVTARLENGFRRFVSAFKPVQLNYAFAQVA